MFIKVRVGLPFIAKFGLEDLFYKYGVDGKIILNNNFIFINILEIDDLSWILGTWTFLWTIMANI